MIIMALSFHLRTSGGVDYEPLSSHLLTFPEDSSQGDSLCTTISIIDDIAVENTESFRVDLATSDAEVAFSSICPSAPVNIFDSDGAKCVFSIKMTKVSGVSFSMASDLVLVKRLLQKDV